MSFPKRGFILTLILGSLLMTSGCADDQMAKGLLVVGGAVGGAFVGSQMAPENQVMGGVIGAGAGGALGFLLGGLVGQK